MLPPCSVACSNPKIARLIQMAVLIALSFFTVSGTAKREAQPVQEQPIHNQERNPDLIKVPEETQKQFGIETEQVQERPTPVQLHITGKLVADMGKEADVSSRISGKIEELSVRPGEEVQSQQVLAVIDSREVSELQGETIEAQAKLKAAEAHELREKLIYHEQLQRPTALIQAQTELEKARVHKGLAESEYKRIHGLFKEKIAAEKDFIVAQAHLSEAQTQFQQALSDYQREEHLFKNKASIQRDYQVAQAETQRDRQHLDTLIQRLRFLGMTDEMVKHLLSTNKISGKVSLRAAAGGVVSFHTLAVGETVEPNQSLFKITDLTNVLVTADLPEVDLPNVHMGDKVTVTVSSYPDKQFAGRICFISESVDPKTRAVPIQARLPNADHKLRVNMFATIELQPEDKMVLACPKSAIQEHDGKSIVFVAKQDGFEKRIVHLGAKGKNFVEIISGLSKGENIVTKGSLMLKSELSLVH